MQSASSSSSSSTGYRTKSTAMRKRVALAKHKVRTAKRRKVADKRVAEWKASSTKGVPGFTQRGILSGDSPKRPMTRDQLKRSKALNVGLGRARTGR